jgi:class 3 adenylate cyclase
MPVQAVERKLAAIFAADIVGYSRLMARDEVGTLARLKACRAIIDELIASHRGRIFNTAGDSVVADFASAVDAVQCAVAVQAAIARENAGGNTDEPMQFRIGVHVGDIMVDGDNLLGDGVNIAARLEALAEPGAIYVSAVVRDQVGNRLPVAFDDLGEQTVKNIARPIRVYALSAVAALPRAAVPAAPQQAKPRYGRRYGAAVAVAGVVIIAGGLWWLWPSPKAPSTTVTAPALEKAAAPAVPAAAPRLSIVVLPFANLSNDPEQQYFAEGITEDLTTDLSRIADSLVISRNTAFTYKDKPVNAKQMGMSRSMLK